MSQGMRRDVCLDVVGLTRNEFYYEQKGVKGGKARTEVTRWRDPTTVMSYKVDNREVVQKIVDIKLDPDHANWYRLITVTLKLRGYYINHKKVSGTTLFS